MAALGANANIRAKGYGEHIQSYPVADNVHIYKGYLVNVATSGYATPSIAAQTVQAEGIAIEEIDNTLTGHAAGGKSIRLESGRRYLMGIVGATQAVVGVEVYVLDASTVTITAGTSKVGTVTEFQDATHVWVWVPTGIKP